MEPRQLRLPGFTRFWTREILRSERRRVRIRQPQALRPVRQRVFVAVRAVEQQHTLPTADESPLPGQTPRGEHGTAFGTEQKAVVSCGVLDRLQDRGFRD